MKRQPQLHLHIGNPAEPEVSTLAAIGSEGLGYLRHELKDLPHVRLYWHKVMVSTIEVADIPIYGFASLAFTLDAWWQCDCDSDNIHEKPVPRPDGLYCEKCGAKQDECSDACLADVLDHLRAGLEANTMSDGYTPEGVDKIDIVMQASDALEPDLDDLQLMETRSLSAKADQRHKPAWYDDIPRDGMVCWVSDDEVANSSNGGLVLITEYKNGRFRMSNFDTGFNFATPICPLSHATAYKFKE